MKGKVGADPHAAVARAGRRPLGALDRLRLRISAWYVATGAGILLVLGTGLFFVVAQQIGRELDHTLEQAASAMAEADRSPGVRLQVPGVTLSITDAAGRVLAPDTGGYSVARVAQRAVRDGTAQDELPLEKEHVLRLRARAFRTASGEVRVAVAAADLEDLEDRYQQLIVNFSVAAVIALALVGFGGVFLARKFARPVEETVARMREFMSDAAHELRTPVAVLRTESEVALARPRNGTEDSAAFQRIAAGAGRLSTVVDDLFMLARAESGELDVERTPVFLDDILSDSVSAFNGLAVHRSIALVLHEFDEAPALGSAVLMRRAMAILLDNALKYTNAGGRVTASTRASAVTVTVEVADTGLGIADADMPRVFDRFYRSDAAREAASGSGLGLAIALRIAQLHGGTLTLESIAGQGTTARLTLPRHASGPLIAGSGPRRRGTRM